MLVIILEGNEKQWDLSNTTLHVEPNLDNAKELLRDPNWICYICEYDLDSVQENMINACRKILKENDLENTNWQKYRYKRTTFAIYSWIFYLVCIYHIDLEYHADDPVA